LKIAIAVILFSISIVSIRAADGAPEKESMFQKLESLFKKVQSDPRGTSIEDVLLSNEDIRKGLAAALTQGVRTAVTSLGKEDGFFKNALVKIPLPENLSDLEKALKLVRQQKLIDDFVLRMNRAAENATPAVGDVLADAILKLTLDDVKSILRGQPDAATQYFKKSSHEALFIRVLPIVQEFTDKAGATKTYKKALQKSGFVLQALGRSDDFDLDKYVTNKALDGLYLTIAAEEKRIRENPQARTTEILKKVFGANKN